MYFCRNRNSVTIGIAEITAPAVKTPQFFDCACETKVYRPTARVCESGSVRMTLAMTNSPAALKAQIATTTQPRVLNLAATSVRSERSRTGNYPLEFDRGGCYMSAMVRHHAWILRITGPVLV